jgi:hypothetical protein
MATHLKSSETWLKRWSLGLGMSVCAGMLLASCGGSSMSTPSRALLSVAVQPGNADAVAPTGTFPFTATGTFDQAPTTQSALSVQWSTSDANVAGIDGNTGVATCVSVGGPVTITGMTNGKEGTAQLTCLASPPPQQGQCVYVCGSTRCGELTGYCSGTVGGACRQGSDLVHCPAGKPAGGMATDSCGEGIDTTRTCTP